MAGIPINEVQISEDVDLTGYNTLGVKATARLFAEVEVKDHLISLHKSGFFKKNKPFILGGGSNVLLLNNLDQPVLRVTIPGIKVISETDDEVIVKAGAGVNWHSFVKWCVDHQYGGVENLALIPGTMGAAPIQNIGAYGVELDQVFENLTAFNMESGELVTFGIEECRFGYRDSIFKQELKGKIIVTAVALKLTKTGHKLNTEYRSLAEYLEEAGISEPGIRDIFEAVIAIRRSKLPDPSLIGNAGSFFKNPVVSKELHDQLRSIYSEMPFYKVDEKQMKIPAGWLIEKAGWKGKRSGNVGTYENQALVIVNFGEADGEEIYNHALAIKESVSEMFGIELVPEVNIFGSR